MKPTKILKQDQVNLKQFEVITDSEQSDQECAIIQSIKPGREIQIIDDGENRQISHFLSQLQNDQPGTFLKKVYAKESQDNVKQQNLAIQSIMNEDFDDSDNGTIDQDLEGVQEIFYMPANFPELIERQIEKIQRQIQKVIDNVQKEISDWMNNFAVRCKNEIKNQFEHIKGLETVNQSIIRGKVSKANKNSKFLCKLIGGITEKFQILDDELIKVRNQFYNLQRRSQIDSSGIQYLRNDKVFYYNKNQTTFQCPMCIQRATTISTLVAHIRKYHRVPVPEGFVCLHCNKTFDVVSKLYPHCWTNHRKRIVDETFTCLGCNGVFKTKFQVYDHVPKCVYYCAAAVHVMRLQQKQEVKIQDFQDRVFNDDALMNQNLDEAIDDLNINI